MKTEHPAPWKWTEFGDLEDAFGDFVLWVDEEGQGKADPSFSIGFAFDRTRALIAAAPEMEALLREEPTLDHVKEGDAEDDCDWDMCRHCGNEVDCDACPKDGPCWGAKIRALLARIDAAKAGS